MPDSLLDKINRRSISIQQFANFLLDEYSYPSLQAAYKVARAVLLDAGEITSRTKLNKILTEINKEVTPIVANSFAGVDKELSALAVAESVAAVELMKEYAPVNIKTPVQKQVKDRVQKALLTLDSGSSQMAGTWASLVKANEERTISNIKAAIQTGVNRGETTASIVKRVKTSLDGVTKNQVETLIRTGVQHVSQQANNAVRDENIDILDREYPITTWDSRRSIICTSLEAKYGVNGSVSHGWPVGKSPVGYPPYHPNCRTIVRALPKGAELEGDRPAIEGKKGDAAKDAFERKEKLADARLDRGGSGVVKYTGRKDKAFRAELIPVKTPLSKFIKSQPAWYQDKLLGKAKAEAFRAGKIDLSQLTDRQLKPLTVDELDL